MKFTAHSPQNLFSTHLQDYANEKLSRPIRKHQLDNDSVSIQASAEQAGENVELKVSVFIPGEDLFQLSCAEAELNAAIDIAADKLQRQLGDLSARKASARRAADIVNMPEELEETDFLTDGEEDVLRELGALDSVLGLDNS